MPFKCDLARANPAEVGARRQQPVGVNLLDGVIKRTGVFILTGPGPWRDLVIRERARIHFLGPNVGFIRPVFSRDLDPPRANRSGDLIASRKRGEALAREEHEQGLAVKHSTGVSTWFCRSLSASLCGNVLPVVTVSRKKPIAGEVVPKSSSSARSTIVILDASFSSWG
jgi:hypothetical protein